MTPIALEPPDFPDDLEHIWSMFLELNECRTNGFSGPNPISYQDIKAWMDLTDTPVTPFEVEGIKRLDKVYVRVTSTKIA